jgi:hypothetical protein
MAPPPLVVGETDIGNRPGTFVTEHDGDVSCFKKHNELPLLSGFGLTHDWNLLMID